MIFKWKRLLFRLALFLLLVYLLVVIIWNWTHFEYLTIYDNVRVKVPSYTLKFREKKFNGADDLEIKVIKERGQSDVMTSLDIDSITNANISVAIATMYTHTKSGSGLFGRYSNIDDYAPYALANFLEYGHVWGYPVFFHHPSSILKSQDVSEVYWSKLSVLEYYLRLNKYDWILWVDIDVYFVRQEIPLTHFLASVPSSYHIVAVLECGRMNKRYLQGAIRSGFFFLRNSPESLEFLRDWKKLQEKYSESLTPEQAAFEELFSYHEKHRDRFYLFPTRILHSYSECIDDDTFSIHFPNSERKTCMKQWKDALFPNLQPVFV